MINTNHRVIFSNTEFLDAFSHHQIGQNFIDYLSNIFSPNDIEMMMEQIKEITSYNKTYAKVVLDINPYEKKMAYIHLDYSLQNFKSAIDPKIVVIFYPIYLLDEQQYHQNLLVQQFDLMLSNAPIAMWSRDYHGKLFHVNTPYAQAFSKQSPTVVQQQCELVQTTSHFDPRKFAIDVIESQKTQVTNQHGIINGQRRFLEIYECPVKHDQINTVGYAIDITQQEESKELMHAYIQSQREVHDLLSTAIGIFNAKGQLDFFNATFLKMFKFDESWLCGRPLLVEVLDNLRQRRKLPEIEHFNEYKKKINHLFNNIMEPIHELWHLSNGVNLKITISPEVSGGLIFLVEDITDKMALEQEYNTLMAVQRETIDNLYEGILVIGSDFRVRLSNPSLFRIWDMDEEVVVVNMHIQDLFHQHLKKRFSAKKKSERWYQETESWLLSRIPHNNDFFSKDKKIRYIYLPLPDGSHLLSFADISDRWLFEKSIKEKNNALEQAYHLKTEFISHVAYELKSPLNTIIGFIDILINQYFGLLNERQLDYCNGIADSSHRLMNLMGDLLDLANIQTGQLKLNYQDISLDAFLHNAVNLVSSRANDNGINIVIENQAPIESIRGDETCLKHALFNLLTNAIRFTLSGGCIYVRAFVEAVREHNYLKIMVQDDGVGISEEEKKQIEKILSAHSKSTTTQYYSPFLGIALVKNLIDLHQGFAMFQSKGDSNQIICYLPISLS